MTIESSEQEWEERSIAQRLEALPVRRMYRHNLADVLLVWRGLKPATDVVIGREWEVGAAGQGLDADELYGAKAAMEQAGLAVVEGEDESGTMDDGEGRPRYAYAQRRCFVAREPQIAERLKRAHDEGDERTFGELVGFPPTAVDAYVGSEQGRGGKLLDPVDLPAVVRESESMAFAQYRLSKEHWREEIGTARRWAEEVKRVSPHLYAEIVRDYRATRTGPAGLPSDD